MQSFKWLMNKKLPEHTGRIIELNKIRGSGYLYSDDDNNKYFFNISSLHGNVQLNDIVKFLLNIHNDNTFVSAIRKVYQNSVGIKFIPRIIGTHIHDGAEPLLPTVFEQIRDIKSEFLEKDINFLPSLEKLPVLRHMMAIEYFMP